MWFSLVVVVVCVATSSAEKPLEWWKTATLYEVYPRSFKDSDGDGIGDLKGIIQNADYFKDIGVDAIWLSPINKSPMVDFGYDISNYTEIDSIFGTMEDFDALVAKMKKIGVKLLIDFVPNHTSEKHEWFQISCNKSHPLYNDYKDFYVWHDPNGTADGKPVPPNNWISVFGGSMWTWYEGRQQFYLHQFAPQQPELNFRNDAVIGNITEILYFWLAKGVDGFRLDAAPHLFEDANFRNESLVPGTPGDTFRSQTHMYTMHLPETLDLLKQWSELVYQWGLRNHSTKVVLLEAYALPSQYEQYYGTGNTSLQVPFNFLLLDYNFCISPTDIKNVIDMWLSIVPGDSAANWVVGNHDMARLPDHYGHEMTDTISLLIGFLPGMKIVYYGDEIGMETTLVSWNRTVDPAALQLGPLHYHERSRDFYRSPMQWNDSMNAGFSTNKMTWLPVNPNYWWLNVEAQKAAPISHLKVFQAIVKARKDPVLQRGDLKVIIPDSDSLILVRSYNGSSFTLVANLGITPTTYTSQNMFHPEGLDMDMTVVVGSLNSGYMPGTGFKKGSLSLTLRPKASVLLKSGYTPSISSAAGQLIFSGNIIIVTILLTVYSVINVL